MIYKEFKELKLSALGLGAMRLPVVGEGDNTRIDEAKTAEMVACALEQGINYFDTAYMYHKGESEIMMGKVLGKYPRDSYYLASKFPGYDPAHFEKIEEIFEEQLAKCGVEYFDFYLFHNVTESNVDAYTDEKYGLMKYLLKQKEAGRIRHLGFSTHGTYDTMKRFLDTYGEHLEFCQIELNYLDWKLQDAKRKVELIREYHLPIWVMEPLRGGKLASLSEENTARLAALRPDEGVPAWGFRFLQSIPDVTMVLSGMSNMEQLQDNIATFGEERPLSDAEWEAVMGVAETMMGSLPCTGCRYCTTYCPNGLDIPAILSLYKDSDMKNSKATRDAVEALPEGKRPADCVGCRSCEAVCPQQIRIADIMSYFRGILSQPITEE